MPTPNYNFPTIDPQAKIDIADDVNGALNSIDTALKNEHDNTAQSISDTVQSIAGKAPINHASADDTYGTSTAGQYGHSKIADDLSYTEDVATAVSPNAIRKVSMYKNLEMVAFGDSFMDPNAINAAYGYLPKTIAETLGMTLHNYAFGGAGFARQTNLISTQIDEANTELTAQQKNNTGLVIIYAGYNDINNDVPFADINTGIINACKSTREMFPNATILLVPYNWGFGLLPDYTNNDIMTSLWTIKRSIYPYAITLAENSRFWIMGNAFSFQNEVHPSETGYKSIATHMLNIILGGDDDTTIGFTIASVNGSPTLTATFRNGLTSIQGYFKPATTINAGSSKPLSTANWPYLKPTHDIITPVINYSTNEQVGIAVFRKVYQGSSVDIRALKTINAGTNYWIVPISYYAYVGNLPTS